MDSLPRFFNLDSDLRSRLALGLLALVNGCWWFLKLALVLFFVFYMQPGCLKDHRGAFTNFRPRPMFVYKMVQCLPQVIGKPCDFPVVPFSIVIYKG